MNLTKDMYEYLLNFADDRAIINMLSVNKKFHDEEFFERIMKRKYPDLIKYRKDNETWKHLFVRMVYYISLITEKFGIPHFVGLNPIPVFNGIVDPFYAIVTKAAEVGNLEVLKLLNFHNRAPIYFNDMLEYAANTGHLNVIKYFLHEKPSRSRHIAFFAAYRGHTEIIKYLVENKYIEEKDLNELLSIASTNNREETTNWLISQGARIIS